MAGNFVLLDRITLTVSASTVVFDNIPQSGYSDLRLVVSARSDRSSAINDFVTIKFNADSTSGNYNGIFIYGSGTTNASYTNSSASAARHLGDITATGATANSYGMISCYIPNYLSSSGKTYFAEAIAETDAESAVLTNDAQHWNGTAAINTITLAPGVGTNFIAGSSFSLYAIADLTATPATAPKANGGDIIANDGTYWYHAFLSSGTFTPQTNLSCNYLVVGGGGSAARYGGGGAGGYRTTSELLTTSSYPVLVGAGGAKNYLNQQGNNGTSSTFSSVTSAGGGGGGSLGATGPGLAGASGGGGGSDGTYAGGAGNTPSTSPSQGNSGGSGTASHPLYSGGGGGGATTSGGDASGSVGGNGGTGSNAHSTWASATGTGVSGYYAGGGGGTGYNYPGLGTAGTGGAGGGGTASNIGDGSGTPNAGIANTGGGGGGGFRTDGSGSNAGGSGIVIIRYSMA